MKNLILIAVLSFLLISCSSNDDDGTTSNDLIGRWQIQNVEWSFNGGAFSNQACSGNFYNGWSNSGCKTNDIFEFTPTSWIWISHTDTQSGTNCPSSTSSENYTLQGNSIMVDNDIYMYTISGNTLQISYTEGTCETRMNFSRIN